MEWRCLSDRVAPPIPASYAYLPLPHSVKANMEMPCRSLDTGFIEAYRMYAAASAAGWIYPASKEKPRLPLKYIVRQDGASTVCHHALPAPTSIPPLPTRNYKPIVPAASAPSQAHKWSVRAPTNLDYQFSTGNHKRFWDLSSGQN